MAFVNEFVPEEEKGRFKDINIWKDPTTGDLMRTFMWTIDRERNAFLVCLGGHGGRENMADYFALCWRGEAIKFQVYEEAIRNKELGAEVSLRIFGIQILDNMKSKENEITDLITEAIRKRPYFFYGKIKEIHIEFIRRTFVWQ